MQHVEEIQKDLLLRRIPHPDRIYKMNHTHVWELNPYQWSLAKSSREFRCCIYSKLGVQKILTKSEIIIVVSSRRTNATPKRIGPGVHMESAFPVSMQHPSQRLHGSLSGLVGISDHWNEFAEYLVVMENTSGDRGDFILFKILLP